MDRQSCAAKSPRLLGSPRNTSVEAHAACDRLIPILDRVLHSVGSKWKQHKAKKSLKRNERIKKRKTEWDIRIMPCVILVEINEKQNEDKTESHRDDAALGRKVSLWRILHHSLRRRISRQTNLCLTTRRGVKNRSRAWWFGCKDEVRTAE